MKSIITFLLSLNFLISFGQNRNLEKWNAIAASDISLQPEYGNIQKSEEQIKSDNEFINEVLNHYKNREETSEKMVELGFTYLYEKGDFVTAMKRFNQAFLLNNKNANVYYGYGTVYFNLGAFDKARNQYDKGLAINSNHSEMLTDYGTTYLGDYYDQNDEKLLKSALNYLEKSYKIDNKNSNTIYKLSIVNMYMNKCKEANEYFREAKKMKNPNITEAFELELNEKCK